MTDDSDENEVLVPDQVSGADLLGGLGGLGDLFGGGGMPDLGGLMAGMAQVQAAQAETYVGQAGGGAVKVTATGTGAFQAVSISPDVVSADDVDMLQDLVLAALNDLSARISEAQERAMGGMSGLGGLGGLLGPSPE